MCLHNQHCRIRNETVQVLIPHMLGVRVLANSAVFQNRGTLAHSMALSYSVSYSIRCKESVLDTVMEHDEKVTPVGGMV